MMPSLLSRSIVAATWALAVVTSPIEAQRGPSAKRAADAFSSVRCDGDIAKSLIGRELPSGAAHALEEAHRDIGLKNTGGSDVSDSLFLGGWQLCGREAQLLTTQRGRIEDVMFLPEHSRRRPAFLGTCKVKSTPRPEIVLAVLNNPSPRAQSQAPYAPEDTVSLAVLEAWSIDVQLHRFAPLVVPGLRCPRGGLFTIDGGT